MTDPRQQTEEAHVSPAPLESVLCTEELNRRPARPPDYATENRALVALAQALADSPRTILQTLTDTILAVFEAHSAGLSLLSKDEQSFFWPAVSGLWQAHVGGGTPRNFGPCGDVLDCNAPLLFKRVERRYPYLLAATPPAEECLLVPFYVKGKAVGTIWAIAHDERRRFDAEDLRQLESLGRFASAAYQATESLNIALEQSCAEQVLTQDAVRSGHALERFDLELRASEEFNRSIIDSSPDCIKVLDLEGNLLSMHNGQELLGIEDIRPFLNKSWIAFWEGGDRQAAKAAVEAAAAGREGRFVGFFRTFRNEPKWWDVTISPMLDANRKPARLLAVSRDVTARRRAEMNLDFLASVSLDLVRLTGVEEMMRTVGAKMAAYLQLSLCAFVEINEAAEQVVISHDWHRDDVPSLVGVHRLADFVGEEFIRTARAGETIVVRDTAADPRTDPEKFAALKIASFVCVPLIRDGQWRFALCLYHSAPYPWREDEIELTRELTARIWTRLERLRAEEALRESEERFRMLFESIDEGFCIIEKVAGEAGAPLDFRYVEVNPAFETQSGMSSMVGKTLGQLLPGEAEGWNLIYDTILKTGEPARFERGLLTHGRMLELYAFRVEDETHRRVAVIFKDVTERKRNEENLRQSEARFRLMADSAPVLIWLSETDKLCVWFNKTWLDYTGRSMEQEIGNGWVENVHPADLDRCLQTYAEAFDARASLSMEYRLKRHDGEYRWFLDIGVPRYAAEREFSGYIGSCTDITEVKQAEAAVRESEERYRSLFNSMDEGYCTIEMIFDEQGKPVDYRYLEINPSFEKLTGMHGALGKRISEFVPDLEEYWYEVYGKVALTGEPIRVANEVKGMNRWFDIYAFRIGGNDSREVSILFRNITESKQAERQAEMLSTLSRELASATEEAEIVEIAVATVGRHLNGHRCYFVECLADENRLVVSRNWVRDEAPSIEGELSLFDFGGIEWWREFASGDFIMEDVATNPLTQANSANYHAVGVPSYAVQPFRRDADWTVCLTVTEKSPRTWTAYELRILADVVARVWPLVERARADRELRESEDALHLALDAAELGSWNIDSTTNLLSSDARFRALFGVTAEELSYEQAFILIHPDDREGVRDAVAAATRPDAPVPYEAEYRVVHPDGSLHWVFAKGRANFGNEPAGRRLLSFDGTVADITGRKRAEEALRESAQALADLDRRKDEFLAMLSHELRNPLAPISNAVKLLQLQKNEDPIQQQARTIIERQVGNLKHLIDDLLEVSRISTGRVQLRQDRIVLSGIVERALETAHPLIVQRRHELTLSVPQQPIWLQADAARLEQVVVNLLTNAAKYTDEGGHLWLTVEQEGDTAVLRVRDTGIGIAPELLPRIFELFTQAERSLDRSQGGLGIGLCLVQRLVDLHGGTVEAHSVLGQGSEFVVRLPVMLTSMLSLPSPSIETARPPGNCRGVLVVDDNVDAAQSLAMLLKALGHEVRMAYDGPSAVEAALDFRPDMVLLDIGLPGLDGFEVARRIRRQPAFKNIVLVAMTGYGQETDRQRSLEAGFDHHLVKPADFDKVQKILASVPENAHG